MEATWDVHAWEVHVVQHVSMCEDADPAVLISHRGYDTVYSGFLYSAEFGVDALWADRSMSRRAASLGISELCCDYVAVDNV